MIIITDPGVNRTTDPDLALGGSMKADITMVSGGSAGPYISIATYSNIVNPDPPPLTPPPHSNMGHYPYGFQALWPGAAAWTTPT